VAFLNEAFSILSEVVFRHGGMVDKFMGDCIMAVFGAIEDQPDHASRALAAAEDMHRFVETQSAEWKKKFDFEVRLGIGVTSGDALVGNLGSAARMEFTAIGDTVNTAARLENLAQAGQTLVSADIAATVGDAYELRALGPHPIRGKREPVELFELVL
jgi:class 3 adenylate cyclase